MRLIRNDIDLEFNNVLTFSRRLFFVKNSFICKCFVKNLNILYCMFEKLFLRYNTIYISYDVRNEYNT